MKTKSSLFIYPTSRNILSNLLNCDDVIMDKSISVSDFFKRAIFVRDKIKLDSKSRIIFLKEAILQVGKDIGFGQEFKSSFLYFLRNSPFVFKFFDEIFAEKSSLEEIEIHDIQGDFIDHIEVLKEVYISYKKILDEKNFYDQSTIGDYEVNTSFLKEYDKIVFVLEGYLSKKEFDILYKCSLESNLYIKLYSTLFNKKMFEYFNKDFAINTKYLIKLLDNEIIEQTQIKDTTTYEVKSFNDRLSQSSFVAKKIYDFINKDKFKPENIALILPDESFVDTLKDMDIYNNLNFAMGTSFNKTKIYKKLQSIYDSLLQEALEETLRLDSFELRNTLKGIKQNTQNTSFEILLELVDVLKKSENTQVKSILIENLYFLDTLKNELIDLSFGEILSYFLHLLKTQSIPHIDGGKVKVMGILESRNIKLDGVIVVDFNDDILPQISQKDIFLNTSIKKHSSIPTKKDRENLQKYYYKRLFQNTKKVAISYVHNAQKIPSNFLQNLNIPHSLQVSDYNSLIFEKNIVLMHKYQKIFTYTIIDKNLSFSKLKTFMQCSQKFYNQYVLKIKLQNTPSIEPKGYELGEIIHNELKNIKTKQDLENIKTNLLKIADKCKKNSQNILSFNVLKFISQMDHFLQNARINFDEGVQIVENEKSFKTPYQGLILEGRIDKIELLKHTNFSDDVNIVDYKISTPPKSLDKNDIQLYFYLSAIQNEHKDKNINLYYHYLPSDVKIYIDKEASKAQFNEAIKKYTQPFDVKKCENKAICRYCDYATMCNI